MAESIVNVTEGSGKKLHTNSRTIGANTVEDEYVLMGMPFFASYVAVPAAVSTATANSHLIQIMAGASLNVYINRIQVWQLVLATTAAMCNIALFRLTTAGTGGTVVTPDPLDQADGAAGATAMTLPTAKGTEVARSLYSASAQFIQTVPTGGSGQNGLMLEWNADRLRTKPLRIPAGTTNGIALKNIQAVAAATVIVNVEFFELNY